MNPRIGTCTFNEAEHLLTPPLSSIGDGGEGGRRPGEAALGSSNQGANSTGIPHPARTPSVMCLLVLIPLMLLELVGLAAAGWKRYGTFEGAILLMAATLALVWNVLGGVTMFLLRKRIRQWVAQSPLSPGPAFVLFSVSLALLEEVVTTTLTNLAPVFGNSTAFITASKNYLEVVLWHSVIAIAPMFVVWAWLLARFKFSPGAVMLLFGINGVLAEWIIGGPALPMAPFWIFVYGLMIFTPAYSYVAKPDVRPPRWFHYPAAIAGCLLASAAVALVVNLLAPHLPHFGATLAFPDHAK